MRNNNHRATLAKGFLVMNMFLVFSAISNARQDKDFLMSPAFERAISYFNMCLLSIITILDPNHQYADPEIETTVAVATIGIGTAQGYFQNSNVLFGANLMVTALATITIMELIQRR